MLSDWVQFTSEENEIEAMEAAFWCAVHDSLLRKGGGVIPRAGNEEQLVQNLEWIQREEWLMVLIRGWIGCGRIPYKGRCTWTDLIIWLLQSKDGGQFDNRKEHC